MVARIFAPPAPHFSAVELPEPEPEFFSRGDVTEIPLLQAADSDHDPDEFERFLQTLSLSAEPLAFELVATAAQVTAQLAVGAADAAHVRQQLQACFPELTCVPATTVLTDAWEHSGPHVAVVDFALGREVMLALSRPKHDLHVSLVGAIASLGDGEMAVVQVLFQPTLHAWAEELVRSVTDVHRRPVFVNAPELADAAQEKAGSSLFGVVLRVLACATHEARAWEILRPIAGALGALGNPRGNELIPLRNDGYAIEDHAEDVLLRQSRRTGMLLSLEELAALVHLPSRAVRHPKFCREARKTKAAPEIATGDTGLVLGSNEHAGVVRTVRLNAEQRTRHVHLIGASGTGKSTLLFQMIRQDIESGQGVGVLDPHGDLIDQLLGVIPESRVQDVVLLDPADEELVVGFNLLSAHSEWEKNLLAADLVAVFRRLSTSWGDQMGSVLHNAILAFLESERGGTLIDLRRFLIEAKFREQFLASVRDPEVAYYWTHGFKELSGNKSIGPVLTRLETFLAPKPLRYMVGQRDNRLDFGAILDGGKIFLARLSQGEIGKENAHLLGSLLVAKIHQAALRRARQPESSRRPFWLYLDEFAEFITPSMAEILTGARKYRLGLTLAHQELRQLQREPETASAVLANCYTRVCFRVGDADAHALRSGFSCFDGADLQSLPIGNAVCRVERREFDFNLAVEPAPAREDAVSEARKAAVVSASRSSYATPRIEIEETPRRPEREADSIAAPRGEPASPPASPPQNDKAVLPLPTESRPSAERSTPVPAAAVSAANDGSPTAVMAERPIQPGRGGVQHKAIQKRIKTAAEALGFRVTIEKSLLDGRGCVDLVLERDDLVYACEVTVTTTLDHEVGNVQKCLEAGFDRIAVIGIDEEKLARLTQAVTASLGPDAATKVSFWLPDDFISELPKPIAVAPKEKPGQRVRGYRVKTKVIPLPDEEARAREAAMIQLLAQSMKEKQKP